MDAQAGSLSLTRLALRRDRIRIAVWIVSIAALAAVTVISINGLFPTQASLDQTAAATQHNAAAIAFNGAPQALNTVGGQVAFNFGAAGMVMVALMSLFMVGRLTRGEEEGGRLELIRSLPVGSHASTIAAAITVLAMNVVVGVLTSAALLAQGLAVSGSLVFGAGFVLVGSLFGALALVVAQLTQSTRVVYGVTGAAVGAAYVVRALGDIGDGTASWLSPIGIAQKARPYAGERWWPLLILIAAIAALVLGASLLASRRDLGAGILAPRPGRPRAARSLGHPVGLAFRLQRGTLIGWSISICVAALAYGSIGPTIDAFIGHNKALAEILAGAGNGSLTDLYFASAFRIMALAGAGFAVQSALRIRTEETSMRAESVLATPLPRWAFAASHLAVACAGCVILLAIAGLSTAASYGLAGGPWSSVPELFGAPFVYAPAMWLMVGLTMALIGLEPRLVAASWALLAACVVVGFLGDVLKIPRWVQDLSPFQRVPQLPGASLTFVALAVIAAIAAGLVVAGLGGLRRRDFGRI